MLEVRLRQGPHGCIFWPLTLVTLGLFPLLRIHFERHFIRTMDETGIETNNKTRVAWGEFKSVQRVKRMKGGKVYSDEYELDWTKGKVSLPMWRAVNAQEAYNYLFAHLPLKAMVRPEDKVTR